MVMPTQLQPSFFPFQSYYSNDASAFESYKVFSRSNRRYCGCKASILACSPTLRKFPMALLGNQSPALGRTHSRQLRAHSSPLIRRISTCRRTVRVCSSANGTSTAVTDARTATVQVDLGYAAEQAVVRLTHPHSSLVEATMQFPLGLVLENIGDEVVVTEVSQGSAADAADCRVGDVVRATTAFTMQMTYPTMNVLFGGVGRPKLTKILVPTDKVPFSKVMAAVRSNTPDQGGDGSVTLVLERVTNDTSSSSSNGNLAPAANEVMADADAAAGDGAVGQGSSGPMFDPRIFNSTFE